MRMWCCVLVIVVAAGTASEVRTATSQSVNARPDQTPFFVCGKDQVLPEAIAATPSNVVLAGDGRLYSPCIADVHPADHREKREEALIRQGLKSTDPAVRWRAAQAFARNSFIQEYFSASQLAMRTPSPVTPS